MIKCRSLDKLNLHLQKPREHQTKQGGDFLNLKVTWPFDHVNNVLSPENLKKDRISWRLNLAGRWLEGGGSESKSRHQLFVVIGKNNVHAKMIRNTQQQIMVVLQ